MAKKKLSIFDIVELAKAGYKAADIKELTEMEVDDSVSDPEKTPAPASQPPAENPPKEAGQDKAGDAGKEDNIDYKSLYEQTRKELEEAQKTNVHQPQPKPNNEDVKTINDIIRDFM